MLGRGAGRRRAAPDTSHLPRLPRCRGGFAAGPAAVPHRFPAFRYLQRRRLAGPTSLGRRGAVAACVDRPRRARRTGAGSPLPPLTPPRRPRLAGVAPRHGRGRLDRGGRAAGVGVPPGRGPPPDGAVGPPPLIDASVELEEVLEEGPLLLPLLVGRPVVVAPIVVVAPPVLVPPIVVVAAAVLVPLPASVVPVVTPAAGRRRGRHGRRGPVDHLVQLPPIEPDPPTLGTEVDLHPLAGRDRERDVTHRALHVVDPTPVYAARFTASEIGIVARLTACS